MPILTHPSDLMPRITHHQRVRWHFFRHHSPCANKRIFPNIVAANDCGICTNSCAFPYAGFHVFVLAIHGAAWIENIGENHGRTEKNVVFANHACVDGDVVLNLYIVAENDIIGDKDVLSKDAIFANFSFGHHMAEVPDFGSFADFASFVNDGGRVGEEII